MRIKKMPIFLTVFFILLSCGILSIDKSEYNNQISVHFFGGGLSKNNPLAQ